MRFWHFEVRPASGVDKDAHLKRIMTVTLWNRNTLGRLDGKLNSGKFWVMQTFSLGLSGCT